ncbi:MAG: ATP-binding protein, partial [Gammaproteobacteria bacterium]|nr:ATP-binding protein [Gammaproteobacteria bacterium]
DIAPKFVDEVNIIADRKKFTQIILNLISNAIKYNKKGGQVTIAYFRNEDETRIEVKDTGLGIPEDKKHEIFSSFCRLGKENSDIEGTGVGLVICKSLIALMNGNIGFESQLGEGSTFYLTIPNAKSNYESDNVLSKTG